MQSHPNSLAALERSRIKHGMYGTPTYKLWQAMKHRVLSPGEHHKKYYSNVYICERWVNSFQNFLTDMGLRPLGATLDRIDNSIGYDPSNCRWAFNKEQSRNRSSSVMLTINGDTKCISEWSEISGVGRTTISKRISLGWTGSNLIQPVGRKAA